MNESKPLIKKWWFWVLIFFGLLTVYGMIIGVLQAEEDIAANKNQIIDTEEKEVKDNQVNKASKIDKTILVNEELLFLDHRVKIKQVKVYEKDEKLLIDIPIDWINHSFPDKTTFFRANSLDVHQGESLLEEVNNAWANKNSNVYFPNAVGGEWTVDLTYELVDESTPVRLDFIVFSEYDKNQEITIYLD